MQSDQQLFSIHDTKADTWTTPMPSDNAETMIRLLRDPCNTPNHQYCKHAHDFHLYKIGNFDTSNGQGVFHPGEHITNLLALVEESIHAPAELASIGGGDN